MRIHWLSLILLLSFMLASCAPSGVKPLPSNPPEDTSQQVSSAPTKDSLPLSNTAASTEAPSTPPPVITKETAEPTKFDPFPSPVVEDGLQKKLTKLAMDDLATRLNTNAEGISVMAVEAIVWPDAALGCPTDKVYAPEKVHGFVIRLKAGEQTYVYHTDNISQVILCPAIKPAEPGLR